VLRSFNVHEPGTKRIFEGLPAEAYNSPRLSNGLKAKSLSLKELKTLGKWLDADAKELQECTEAGEAWRCRFLIPTVPAENPNWNSEKKRQRYPHQAFRTGLARRLD
jgi:hypothetical protein